MHVIASGEKVINAMDLRVFGDCKCTWLRQLHFQLRDYLFMGLGVAIMLAYFAIRIFGYGEFWAQEFMYRQAGSLNNHDLPSSVFAHPPPACREVK
jgi:hypothetical protein